jgi:hypothetical protein
MKNKNLLLRKHFNHVTLFRRSLLNSSEICFLVEVLGLENKLGVLEEKERF